MACGCAVVASRVGGNPELVIPGETGLLFEAGQSDDLAAARQAAEATAASQQFKLQGASDTERQTQGGTSSQVTNAQAQHETIEL